MDLISCEQVMKRLNSLHAKKEEEMQLNKLNKSVTMSYDINQQKTNININPPSTPTIIHKIHLQSQNYISDTAFFGRSATDEISVI